MYFGVCVVGTLQQFQWLVFFFSNARGTCAYIVVTISYRSAGLFLVKVWLGTFTYISFSIENFLFLFIPFYMLLL